MWYNSKIFDEDNQSYSPESDYKYHAKTENESEKKIAGLIFFSFIILSSIVCYLPSFQKSGSIIVPLTVQSAQPLVVVITLSGGIILVINTQTAKFRYGIRHYRK